MTTPSLRPFVRLFGRYLREQGLPVTHQREAVVGLDATLHGLDLGALELDDLSALQAHQVLVHRLAGQAMLVPLEALPEVVLLHQATSHQQVQCPVDCGLADAELPYQGLTCPIEF